jgi:hypothetical protein
MIRQILKDSGFAHYKSGIKYEERDALELSEEFSVLEADPYAPKGVKRYRRYGNGVILPWKNEREVHWIPPVPRTNGVMLAGYDQGGNNPEHANIRYFHSLSSEIKRNALLNNLILEDFAHTFWDEDRQPLPIYFGVHFVKLQANGNGELGISSPNCFHQDGEPFTFAHLVYRSSNAQGGVNYIGKVHARNKTLPEVSDEEILKTFTLSGFMESFAVSDVAVSHYVDPIFKEDDSNEPAERCIVLIDFSPMSQMI